MLIIRDEQIKVFETALRKRFIKALAKELRDEHKECVEDLGDEELYDLIDEGVERAEKEYGLESDSDVKTFVKLLFTVGWYFDHYELFQFYLTDESCEPDERMDFIFEVATDEDWQSAAELSDELVQKEDSNGSLMNG
jgi:hypothetical protein